MSVDRGDHLGSGQTHNFHPEGALTGYRSRKLQLSDLIRGAISLAMERRDDRGLEQGRKLLARLAEDRFQLAVVGQFSRGKSTLMNAILGHAYLPMGALPMTTVVTTVGYGSTPRVMVQKRADRLPIELSLDDLARFVARAGTEREDQHVVSAEVRVPAEILRLGFEFVDTPGIGSAIAENTATTRYYLPDADAVIFVTSFDSPLSEHEVEFLPEIERHVDRLFFVINKLDLVSAEEATEVIRFVGKRLGQGNHGAELRIFPVSARNALEANWMASAAPSDPTGLLELEQSLVQFLTRDKTRTLLQRSCDRLQYLLAQQRLDLELADDAGDNEHRSQAIARFDHRIKRLIKAEQAVAAGLLARATTELSGLVAERSQTWTEQLRKRLRQSVPTEPPDDAEVSRNWTAEAGAKLNDAARRLIEEWQHQACAEARSRILSVGSDSLAQLRSQRDSVESLAAETFGLDFPEGSNAQAWSPADLPDLRPSELVFHVNLRTSRRLWARPGSRPQTVTRTRLLQTIGTAVSTYIREFGDALLEAAREWVRDIAAAVERETQKAAGRVRANAGAPVNREQQTILANLGRRLEDLRADINAWEPDPAPAVQTAPVERRANTNAPCVICQRVASVPFDFMSHAQWELARLAERRASHARRGGFCPTHTWQYAEMAFSVGIAAAYPPVAWQAAEVLEAAGTVEPLPAAIEAALARLVPGQDGCSACIALADAEAEAIGDLVAELPQRVEHVAAPSLCLPHLAAVLAGGPAPEQVRWLIEGVSGRLRRVSEDLQTYSLKRESLRRNLLNDEEHAASLYVISQLAGHRELVRPWRQSDELG